MSSLLAFGVRAREWRPDVRFERATTDPARAQARCLESILGPNAETSFGREHGFGTIQGWPDYRRQVPIRDYEAFRPYVQRMERGEADVLTAEPLLQFAATSGTTAEPKLIPVTARWRAETAALTRLWLYRARRDHNRALDHRLLTVVGRSVEGRTARGVPFGAMSGILQEASPRIARGHLAVPSAIARVEDPDIRYLLIARLALAGSISAIVTPNPTTLLRLAETAAAHADDIVRSVHDGTLGVPKSALDGPGSPPIAALGPVRAALRPDPRRARVLDGVISAHGRLWPRHCWPDLALIGCWLGGSAGVHAHRLAEQAR